MTIPNGPTVLRHMKTVRTFLMEMCAASTESILGGAAMRPAHFWSATRERAIECLALTDWAEDVQPVTAEDDLKAGGHVPFDFPEDEEKEEAGETMHLLTKKLRANVAAALGVLLPTWLEVTDNDVALMFTDLDDHSSLDDDAIFNYELGYVRGVADSLDVPVEDLLTEIDPHWRARCPHGGFATGAGGCPACA